MLRLGGITLSQNTSSLLKDKLKISSDETWLNGFSKYECKSQFDNAGYADAITADPSSQAPTWCLIWHNCSTANSPLARYTKLERSAHRRETGGDYIIINALNGNIISMPPLLAHLCPSSDLYLVLLITWIMSEHSWHSTQSGRGDAGLTKCGERGAVSWLLKLFFWRDFPWALSYHHRKTVILLGRKCS